jgi:nucleoside-diphosphate-sugar epimerase
MEIVGNGFLARNLRSVADAHAGVVALAAGVSTTAVTSAADFDRDAASMYACLRRCAASGAKLVYFSTASGAMYGGSDSGGREDGPVYPQSAYGRHKLAMEAAVARSGVDHLTLRLSNLAGPYQPPHQLLPTLVNSVRAGEVTIYRGAHRDIIDVAHVVTILDLLLAMGISRTVVNVASGFSVPIDQLVEHIERRTGTSARKNIIDASGEQSVQTVNIDKLRALVPETARMPFGAGYYRDVLDRYIDAAATL